MIPLQSWADKNGQKSIFIRSGRFRLKRRPFAELSRARQYKLAPRMQGYFKDEYGAIFVDENARDPRGVLDSRI